MGVEFELFVIGYPRNSHVDYMSCNGFLSHCFLQFQNLWKVLQAFLLKIILELVYLINS